MFWFKPFRNFLRKITIFRNFDQWSEILSMSDGRPLSQGVCPSLHNCHGLVVSPPTAMVMSGNEALYILRHRSRVVKLTCHSGQITHPPTVMMVRRPIPYCHGCQSMNSYLSGEKAASPYFLWRLGSGGCCF
jgi:hypothetical protein